MIAKTDSLARGSDRGMRSSASPAFQRRGTDDPASRYKTQAKQYRFFGSLLRFDHQQPLAKEEATSLKGKEDPRGITYWGYNLSCPLVGLFGDTKIVEFKDYEVAIAIIPQPLLLLDIRDKAAMAAGSVAALGAVADRLVSQAWSRFLLNSLNGGSPRNGFLKRWLMGETPKTASLFALLLRTN